MENALHEFYSPVDKYRKTRSFPALTISFSDIRARSSIHEIIIHEIIPKYIDKCKILRLLRVCLYLRSTMIVITKCEWYNNTNRELDLNKIPSQNKRDLDCLLWWTKAQIFFKEEETKYAIYNFLSMYELYIDPKLIAELVY